MTCVISPTGALRGIKNVDGFHSGSVSFHVMQSRERKAKSYLREITWPEKRHKTICVTDLFLFSRKT